MRPSRAAEAMSARAIVTSPDRFSRRAASSLGARVMTGSFFFIGGGPLLESDVLADARTPTSWQVSGGGPPPQIPQDRGQAPMFSNMDGGREYSSPSDRRTIIAHWLGRYWRPHGVGSFFFRTRRKIRSGSGGPIWHSRTVISLRGPWSVWLKWPRQRAPPSSDRRRHHGLGSMDSWDCSWRTTLATTNRRVSIVRDASPLKSFNTRNRKGAYH